MDLLNALGFIALDMYWKHGGAKGAGKAAAYASARASRRGEPHLAAMWTTVGQLVAAHDRDEFYSDDLQWPTWDGLFTPLRVSLEQWRYPVRP